MLLFGVGRLNSRYIYHGIFNCKVLLPLVSIKKSCHVILNANYLTRLGDSHQQGTLRIELPNQSHTFKVIEISIL